MSEDRGVVVVVVEANTVTVVEADVRVDVKVVVVAVMVADCGGSGGGSGLCGRLFQRLFFANRLIPVVPLATVFLQLRFLVLKAAQPVGA